MSLYSKYILPKVLDFCCATKPIRKQREKVVPLCKGIVLEIGSGSGLNFPYYKTNKVKIENLGKKLNQALAGKLQEISKYQS